MKQNIRHRRLFAFYQSKVLNILILVIIVGLLLMACTHSMLITGIGCGIAFLFFIAYTVWLWWKKPASIVINNKLSNLNSLLGLYYIIVVAFSPSSPWWYIIPAAISVIILVAISLGYGDERFNI